MEIDTGVRFVYMLVCRDGSIYVGQTKNLMNRLDNHQRGFGGRYTKGRRPVQLAWAVQTTKDKAPALEQKLKRLSHKRKRAMIQSQEGTR